MQIGPKFSNQLSGSISDYVIKKWSEERDSSQSLSDHYAYKLPLKSTPNGTERKELHNTVRDVWDGDLPTIVDPTAGGGTIPLEALRYGFPVRANELNPVAWLINKIILDFAPNEGSLENDVRKWASKIDERVSKEIEEYYPSNNRGYKPTYYFRAYSIECPSCGHRLPLSNRWWFNKDSGSTGDAIKPIPSEEYIEYEHLHFDGNTSYEFEPSEGTVQSGDAECPTCGVVTESEKVKNRLREDKFEFEVCGVKEKEIGSGNDYIYRAATQEDREAIKSASDEVESSLSFATLLTGELPDGSKTREARSYGIEQWRELFTPRQLLALAKYLEAYEEFKPKIIENYSEQRANAILALLTLVPNKLVSYTSRLCPINLPYGAPENMMGANNYSFKWQFGENNPTFGNKSYERMLESRRGVLASYEHMVDYIGDVSEPDVKLYQGDARTLKLDQKVDAVVIDPPYGDNVMYSELSDVFYVWHRLYLADVFPDIYSDELTDKDSEAVENLSRYSDKDVSSNPSASSRTELARRDYEEKMSDIFGQIYDSLNEGGVLTVYFTDKETAAWDSLTMSLINSDFTITATHTITSEVPGRIAMQGSASADSTLLLTCRKPLGQNKKEERIPSLWSDIRSETREAAQEKAAELLDSELNLTKTDTIISAFGPTLRVFTENYPVVDKHDELVRPKRALEEARTAVVEVLVDRELDDTLDNVDNLSTWYILSWLVYEKDSIPYDDARQLGLGVGVDVDNIKRDTKIWGKSGDTLLLKGQKYRVRDYAALEAGEKRRKRAYPIDPRDSSYEYKIDVAHAAFNVIETKGSDFTWNWLNDRGLQDDQDFRRVIKSLLQVLPENHEDRDSLVNLVSGQTGDLLDISENAVVGNNSDKNDKTTLNEF
jgi:adenine-specific DNA methylase